jgi:hypothetical protein
MPREKGEVHRHPCYDRSYKPAQQSAQLRYAQNRTKDSLAQQSWQPTQLRDSGHTPQQQRRSRRHKEQVFNHTGTQQCVGNPSANGWLSANFDTGRPLDRTSLGIDHLWPALRRMANHFKLGEVPGGTGFHAFRYAYILLIKPVDSGDFEQVKKAQMTLLRQSDERVNDRYGKSTPPLRQRARQAHANVAELAMGGID